MSYWLVNACAGYGARAFLSSSIDEPDVVYNTHQLLKTLCCWGGSDKRIEAPTVEDSDRCFLGYEIPEEHWERVQSHLRSCFGDPMSREEVMKLA